jgi:hypothetical protein
MILLYLILDKALLPYEQLRNEKEDFIDPTLKVWVLGRRYKLIIKKKWEQNHVALLPCLITPPCTHRR